MLFETNTVMHNLMSIFYILYKFYQFKVSRATTTFLFLIVGCGQLPIFVGLTIHAEYYNQMTI